MMPALSFAQARPLLAARGLKERLNSSCDLNRSREEVRLTDEGVEFSFGLAPWAVLEKAAAEDRKVFVLTADGWREARVFSQTTGTVRSLCPTQGAPTTLVSGFPMHRIKDTDPWQDSRTKLEALGPVKGRVLDTCTGLGYTAILASRRAKEVATVEHDPSALEIARMNPWSDELFTSAKITLVQDDVADYVQGSAAGSFQGIIHDPPSPAIAGELYSVSLYREFRRVLSFRGRMFHYIGDPDSALGARTTEGVIRRLHEAGFKKVERAPEAFGLAAY